MCITGLYYDWNHVRLLVRHHSGLASFSMAAQPAPYSTPLMRNDIYSPLFADFANGSNVTLSWSSPLALYDSKPLHDPMSPYSYGLPDYGRGTDSPWPVLHTQLRAQFLLICWFDQSPINLRSYPLRWISRPHLLPSSTVSLPPTTASQLFLCTGL